MRTTKRITAHLTALALAAVLLPTSTANAERLPAGSAKVSVSYEVSMERPDDEALLDEAMRRSREMVYSRVKLECAEMKRHIAVSCELTSLDVKQGTKQPRREGRKGTISIRASARYKIELSDAMKK